MRSSQNGLRLKKTEFQVSCACGFTATCHIYSAAVGFVQNVMCFKKGCLGISANSDQEILFFSINAQICGGDIPRQNCRPNITEDTFFPFAFSEAGNK